MNTDRAAENNDLDEFDDYEMAIPREQHNNVHGPDVSLQPINSDNPGERCNQTQHDNGGRQQQ